jgi:hypothetical protein
MIGADKKFFRHGQKPILAQIRRAPNKFIRVGFFKPKTFAHHRTSAAVKVGAAGVARRFHAAMASAFVFSQT